MTSKTTGNALSALPMHKVEYAVQKRKPVMLPRKSNASLNFKTSVETNREIRRIVSKSLNNSLDVNFDGGTKILRTKENGNHRLKSCDRQIAFQEWSHSDVAQSKVLHHNKTNLRKNKLIFNHLSLPIGYNKTVNSISDIKTLTTSDNPRIKPSGATRNWSVVVNAPFTDNKNECKINTSKEVFESNAFTNKSIKQPTSRNLQKNTMKTETRNILLPTDKRNLSCNDCTIKYKISNPRRGKEPKSHHAPVNTSLIKLKSFSQCQVKQKYRRSSLHLKPFSFFFRKKSSDKVSSVHFDLTSTVNCTKEVRFPEKSKDLKSSCQNNVVDVSPGKNRLLVLFKKSSGTKYDLLRKCRAGVCISKDFNPSMYCPKKLCHFRPESKTCETKSVSLSTLFDIKQVVGKEKHRLIEKQNYKNKSAQPLEQVEGKKKHRLIEKQNCKNKSAQPLKLSCLLKHNALICDCQCVTSKNKLNKIDKNISLRTCQVKPQRCSKKTDKIDSHKSNESFLKDDDNKVVCLRNYVKRSQRKSSAINISSSFNFRIDMSNDHTITSGMYHNKMPKHESKTIIRPVVSNKNRPTTLNKIPEASSIYIKTVYSKSFPITDTKNVLKEEAAPQKIQINKRNQNKDSPTQVIDKQVLGDKSAVCKVQNVEHDSILKRCFRFIFNKHTEDGLKEADHLKQYKKNDLKNKKFNKADVTMKKYNFLESRNFHERKNPDVFEKSKSAVDDVNIRNKQDILYSTKTAFENSGFCPLSMYTEHPADKLTVSNENVTSNYHKCGNRILSNFSVNVEFDKDSRISFHKPDEFIKQQMVPTPMSSQIIYDQGVQKIDMVNPVVMSLLHKTIYANNKFETSNITLRKRNNNVFKVKSKDYDDTLALYEHRNKNFKSRVRVLKKINQDFEENDTSFEQTEPKSSSHTNCVQQSYESVKLNRKHHTTCCFPEMTMYTENQNLRKSKLLKCNDDNCRKHFEKKYSTSNTSNKLSRYTGFRSKSRFLISHLSSIPKIKKEFKRSSSTVIEAIENSTKVFQDQEKSKITAAYCHVTYDRAGNAICERDTTCAPQCDWITKDGKRVKAKAHVIDNFCPFEDGNFMIQPCMIETQKNNKKMKSIFFQKCFDKKKCDCVCSRGDARINEKNNLNTYIKPKLSIAVDCNTMNIKNREEILKKVIKLKDEELLEFGESQGENKSPCCCTGSKPKNLRCMSCTNIPNRPILKQTLTMNNMNNEPLLEIKMDSGSNILNRKELMERIKEMKDTKHLNESLQSNDYTNVEKILNKVKNKLTNKPVCICKDAVCSRDSEEEQRKIEEANKKQTEKPCVCGAPSCERYSIQRLMKEGKLSKKDGRIILGMIKKQEKIQKKEEARKQKERVLKERQRIKEKHMQKKKQQTSKKKSKGKKKLTAEMAKKGKLTDKELKQLPKEERELLKQSAKKQSIAQKETMKIQKAMKQHKIEDEERKAKEQMQERHAAADLEMKFKRQMLADERKEKKGLRKRQFAEKIKRAKESRLKKMRAKKLKKKLALKKQKLKLREQIEDEEIRKQKEKQQLELAEKERIHREQLARTKKQERLKEEKVQMKKQKAAVKLKLLKEKRKRAALLKKKKEKEKKLKMKKIQKENKRFLNEMAKIAAVERKQHMKEAEKKRKYKLKRHEFMRAEIKKYKDADDRYLVIESLKEAGACCVKYTGKFFDYLMYSAKHPKLTYKKMRRAYLQPGEVTTEMQKDWSESDVHDIANRIEAKILAIDRLQPIGKQLYEKPKKKKIPKHTFKKRKRNRRAPMDFGCSLYMASLRRKPYFFLYWMCPWFYPHLISMLKVLRQLADLGLFVLAALAWSPFILIYECLRTIMCCGLCTA